MAAQESPKSTRSTERDRDENQYGKIRIERSSYGNHFRYGKIRSLSFPDFYVRAIKTRLYTQNGQKYTVNANKEVILSAGTINSPQLLLLSGIGPKSQLDNMKISTVVNLPGVGENLHNHQSYGIDFTLKQPKKDELNMDSAELYLYNQTGPMSSTGLAQLTGILVSNYTTADDPDIQIFFSGFQAVCNTGNRIVDLTSRNNKETVRFTSVNLQPRSRGKEMIIKSTPS